MRNQRIAYTSSMNLPPSPPRTTLMIILLIGVISASTSAVFIRFAQADGVDSLIIAAARLSIATLLLAPLALTKHLHAIRSIKSIEWILALFSGLFLALHFASWVSSLEFTSVASSVVLVSTTPLWVAICAPLLLRERIGYLSIFGLILALIGGSIIGLSDICPWQKGGITCPPIGEFINRKAFLGNSLALFGAWMAAGYLLVGRKLRDSIPLVPYIFIVYGMAATTLVIINLFLNNSLSGLLPQTYLWLFLLALIPQLLGHTIFNWSLKFLPASFISVALLGEPVGSTIFASFFFQEIPSWMKIFGSIVLLIGIWLSAKRKPQ